jgi:polyvinyl alcohol dehydrogenase (cytochrome)
MTAISASDKITPVKRLLLLSLLASSAAYSQDGQTLYDRNCASCHNGGMDRAPNRQEFTGMTATRVLNAMETGAMVTMALRLDAPQRRTVAEFLTGKKLVAGALPNDPPNPAALCSEQINARPFTPNTGPAWNGWGVNTSNTRFSDDANAGIKAADIPKLKVKWAFGFPGDLQAYSQPVVAGGRVFIGSQGGRFYSLNAATGCIHWYYDIGAGARSAANIANIGTAAAPKYAVFFGDSTGWLHALDATTGKSLYKVRIDEFPVTRLTGAVAFHNGRLYVPVASGEEAAGSDPSYECCKFRGGLAALNAADGKQLWRYYTVDVPKPTKKNAKGTQLYGPAGAPVWSSPAIDAKNNAIIITTGNNYAEPTTETSNSFISLDLDNGKVNWIRQMTSGDAYISACRLPDKTNCPDADGPDFDFSSGAILVNLPNGKRALVAGQKSGMVHAIDPDNKGEIIWSTRVGKGGTMGGVQWGSAVDPNNVYVALSDIGRIKLNYSQATDADPNVGGGMFALSLRNGEKIWYTPPAKCGSRPRCSPAQSAAVSAMPGVAFSGSVDGHLRAYSATNGKVIWDFDTVRDFPNTVNKVPARGGSMDGPGAAIAGGMIYVNSGYPTAGGTSGNVLLAFSVEGK